MSSIVRRISRKIDKSIFGYGMITPGDRILIGISGGKDSATLLHQLGMKQHGFSVPFTVEALHVRTEYAEIDDRHRLVELCDSVGVPLHEKEISVSGRLKEGRRMNCHWCSTQRRTELLRFADQHGSLGNQRAHPTLVTFTKPNPSTPGCKPRFRLHYPMPVLQGRRNGLVFVETSRYDSGPSVLKRGVQSPK